MRTRRNPSLPVGLGEPDIPYDRSGMSQEGGISGIPAATGGLRSMKLDFAEQQAPQIPEGAGIPPAGMQSAIPPAGMQSGPDPSQMDPQAGGQSPLLAGLGVPQQTQGGMDTSMFSDQDLMGMVDDGSEQQGDQMFQQSMQDPQIQQQLLLAARRQMGGGGF